jgi:hypothetical protein
MYQELQASFQSWYTTQLAFVPAPNFYLPSGLPGAEELVLQFLAHVPFGLVAKAAGLVLDVVQHDVQVPSQGAAAMLRWMSADVSNRVLGRTFLGPIGQSHISGDGVGQMTPAARVNLTYAWASLPGFAGTWCRSEGGLQLVVPHSRPQSRATGEGGLFDQVGYCVVPDHTLRSLSRRVVPELPGSAIPSS